MFCVVKAETITVLFSIKEEKNITLYRNKLQRVTPSLFLVTLLFWLELFGLVFKVPIRSFVRSLIRSFVVWSLGAHKTYMY